MTELTHEIVKELLLYNPETGVFTWKFRDQKWFETKRGFKRWNSRYANKFAGCIRTDHTGKSYFLTRFFGKDYLLHRIAWLYMTGAWPDEIDHIDGNGTNNKWTNLRTVSRSENLKNKRQYKNNSSGCTGVSWYSSRKKWNVQICINGKNTVLGRFNTLQEAISVRHEAEITYGYHSNHGKNRPL